MSEAVIVTSDSLYELLRDWLGLPAECIKCVITFEARMPVVIEVETYVTRDGELVIPFETVAHRYKLINADEIAP